MKLLFVEDDKDLSNSIARVLKFNNYAYDLAYDGVEALEFLEVASYDVVVLDVMMPKLDGISVVRRMRQMNNNTPVLLLTALSEIDDKVSGLDAGADDYLSKPFAIKELLARIRALSRRTQTVFEKFTIGNITLDSSTYEIKAEGSVRLTNKEYKIMELLIRNKNNIISTERIMETIWEYDSDAEINVVWVFISSLRKKLEQINASHYIKASRGVGYRLEEK